MFNLNKPNLFITQVNRQKNDFIKSTKNWFDWDNSKHFNNYSIDSGTGKFVRFRIAA